MSNRKLSLLVNFVGVDKMSGALRNIVGLGKKGGQSLNALRGEGRKLESQLRKVRSELAGASGNVTQLIDRERQLERAIEGVNADLERKKKLLAIEGDKRAMMRRGEDLKNRGRDNIVQGVGLAAPFVLAGKAAMDFSSGMVDIQQKAELTDAATDRLSRRIITMSASAKQMPEDIRSGLDVLLAKGLGLDAATAAIGPAGRLATAYKVDIPDAASAAFASLQNLKIASADTGRVFDAMAAAGNEGGFEVRDMARHFPSLTAQMQALGEKGVPAVADLSAALQVAMNTAGNADEAGNNIKNLLAKINAPATIRAFQKNFGVDLPAAMAKLEKQGYSSLEAIALVTKEATGGDMKRLGFAFEDMQARQGILALIQNLEEYRRVRAAAMDSGGTVDKAFDQRVARDASVQWAAFKSSASQVAITLGTTLLPIMNETLGIIGGLATRVAAWAERNPELASTLTKAAAAVIAFKIGLGLAQFAFGGLLGPLAKGIALFRKVDGVSKFGTMLLRFKGMALSAASGAVRAFGMMRTAAMFLARGVLRAGLMMMANPIVLVIAAIVLAIGAAAYLIYTHWDKIKAAFQQGVAFVAGLAGRMLTIGKSIVTGLANGILAAPGAVWNALKNVVMGGIGRVKKLLGINSPSRVFMAIGENTSEGLTKGIERTGRRPVRAMGKLATGITAAGAMSLTPIAAGAASPAARGPAATASTASGTTVNIYLQQQPGQSANDMAREIRRELKKLDASADRGSYDEGDG